MSRRRYSAEQIITHIRVALAVALLDQARYRTHKTGPGFLADDNDLIPLI